MVIEWNAQKGATRDEYSQHGGSAKRPGDGVSGMKRCGDVLCPDCYPESWLEEEEIGSHQGRYLILLVVIVVIIVVFFAQGGACRPA